ncbi:hypothetical protein Zmor_004511 [Zophobas morio]|uniref:Transketolase-like pyrimidine-binding domain-containing protein n=1 Tax=Zophobas morio TaxID=2755281 RepID=A0AA38HHT4_9CUCU|nr:hypothetical protein Zmor_004511 [Zophobas morio]
MLKKDKNIRVFHAGMNYVYDYQKFKNDYPDQFIDAGIAEEIAIIEAAAAANAGKTVYFTVASSFFQRCYDQIVHDLIRNNSNVKLIVIRGMVTDIGDSHHGIYDLNMYNSFENVKIFMPITVGDMENSLKEAAEYKGPVVIRLDGDLDTVEAMTSKETK